MNQRCVFNIETFPVIISKKLLPGSKNAREHIFLGGAEQFNRTTANHFAVLFSADNIEEYIQFALLAACYVTIE